MSSSDSLKNLASSMLINLIKNSFHERHFNEAENILIARENDMKMEIENLTKDRDSVKRELERLDLLEKHKLEEKLLLNEKKCDDLEERVARLLEETKVSNDREKRAVESRDKVFDENIVFTYKNNKFILKLLDSVSELKDKILENERLADGYKEKYRKSDMMVVRMEQEIEGLKDEGVKAAKTIEELRSEIVEANTTIDELRVRKSESDKLAEKYKNGLEVLWERIKKNGEDLADMLTEKVRDATDLFNATSELKTSEEEANLGLIPVSKGENGISGAHTSALMSAGDIIEILDSDDEESPDGSAAGTSNVVEIKETSFVQDPSCSKRNRTNCSEDHLLVNSTAKRNRIESCSSSRKHGEDKLNVEWSWKRNTLKRRKAEIKLYSKLTVVSQIDEELKLTGDGVHQDFSNSCFGFLMGLDTHGSCCIPALHYLFAHEVVKANADPDELWYRVGGRFIRFSKHEFALVTGLSFKPTTFDPSEKHDPPVNGLFFRHYKGQRVKMDDLRSDFTKGEFRGSPDDALKVAKLLIFYFLLFGRDGRHSYIHNWAWTLVEDINQWETFIWGKYTYQYLLINLRRVPTKLQNPKRLHYHFYGYVWAFLIWAYEAIPELGKTCGVRVSDDVIPRCLRWRLPKSRVDIKGFYDSEIEVHSTLEASAEEQRQPYWEHINDDLRSGVCYVDRWDKKKKKKKKTDDPFDPLPGPPSFNPLLGPPGFDQLPGPPSFNPLPGPPGFDHLPGPPGFYPLPGPPSFDQLPGPPDFDL
ncbi:hypothetical protein CASFOL_010895 [Castilleja foliolosa]|uniref:DUF1985 domain-containing protein n=1 Tax=Castilleja foliolosa TaxID=1961234 RepID=A0ABD3DXY1_9LAMI